eukprot:scaffold173_cov56-Cyclotella_meneghiniana.AAC.1
MSPNVMTCHCDMRHDIILGPSQHFVTKTGDTWELLNQQKLLSVTLIRLFAMTNGISFVVKFLKYRSSKKVDYWLRNPHPAQTENSIAVHEHVQGHGNWQCSGLPILSLAVQRSFLFLTAGDAHNNILQGRLHLPSIANLFGTKSFHRPITKPCERILTNINQTSSLHTTCISFGRGQSASNFKGGYIYTIPTLISAVGSVLSRRSLRSTQTYKNAKRAYLLANDLAAHEGGISTIPTLIAP